MGEKIIDECCICGKGGGTEEVFSLAFEDITGMAHDYTQRIGICKKCGFLFTMNPFSEEQLENRYKHESKFEFDSEQNVQNENDEYMDRCKKIKQFISGCVGRVHSILEIGAASGFNLSLYEEASSRLGVEPSGLNCELAKKRYGVKLFHGTFREFRESGAEEKYDLIFLSMVLEHIVNPFRFMKELKKYNNRYFFIEVPTLDIKNVDEPFGMMCEEHVNIFTFESLNNLMTALGYGLVDARIEYGFEKGYPAGWPCLDTVWELGKSPVRFQPVLPASLIMKEYIRANQRALEEVRAAVDRIPDDLPAAVWGTGHHASMLLKNTSLGRKNIVKFYDSDKRKYGYTMHGKPIEEYCCRDISASGIKGIIVGSYIFQEVISRRIRESGADCEIFTLYRK